MQTRDGDGIRGVGSPQIGSRLSTGRGRQRRRAWSQGPWRRAVGRTGSAGWGGRAAPLARRHAHGQVAA
jgi:hypothetical protein